MIGDACWVITTLLLVLGWVVSTWRHQPRSITLTASIPRLLKPRTPNDCPACRH